MMLKARRFRAKNPDSLTCNSPTSQSAKYVSAFIYSFNLYAAPFSETLMFRTLFILESILIQIFLGQDITA